MAALNGGLAEGPLNGLSRLETCAPAAETRPFQGRCFFRGNLHFIQTQTVSSSNLLIRRQRLAAAPVSFGPARTKPFAPGPC